MVTTEICKKKPAMHSTEERALRHKKSKCKGPVARRSLAHLSERHVTSTVATERAAPGSQAGSYKALQTPLTVLC